MNTQKITITIPTELLASVDEICREAGISRNQFVSDVLKEKIVAEKEKRIKDAYDRVFSDEAICEEQLEWTRWFDGAGLGEGLEW